MDIRSKVNSLHDEEAVALLKKMADAIFHDSDPEIEWNTETRMALKEALEVKAPSYKASDGEIARAALHLAASTPETAQRLAVYIETPSDQKYDAGVTIGLITAALIVLQLKVRFKSDAKGTSVLIEKPSASDSLLKPLVEKMLSYVPDGPFRK